MTQPVAHGYADWQRVQAQSDTVFVQDQNVVTSVPITRNVGAIANTRTLYVTGSANSNACRVKIVYYADAATTILIDDYAIDMQQNDSCAQIVPVLGPFCQVVIQPGAATPINYTLFIVSAPEHGLTDGFFVPAADIHVTGAGLAASATVTTSSQNVTAGAATWTAFATVTGWEAHLISVDRDGNETILDMMDNTQPAWNPRPVYVPPTHIRIKMINDSAGAGTFYVHMTRYRGA